MSASGSCRFARPVVLSVLILVANGAQVQATTRYFDVNGTTAGSGVTAAGTYSWEDPLWNSNDTTGTTATTAWTDADFPKFAAGTDAGTLTYTVTASAVHTINGMQLAANGGGTVNINTTGAGALNVGSGLQGLFVATLGNLKINTPLGGVDATSALQWSGGGGSAYLYGANTFQGGVSLNTGNGLNFNNSQSFGTGPITYTTVNTAVLANPDVGNFTITNPLTMPAQITANKTMIYTGVAPVTFTNWTLGDSPGGFTISNVLTVANNAFTSAKLIINNLAGTANSNLTVSSPAGVNGTLVLTGTSTYGGAFSGGATIIGTNTTGNPALQANDGAGLPSNSLLMLNGGVLQMSGSFTRPLAGFFGPNMVWNIGGGGFSAIGSQLTVDIGGAGAQLAWGDSTLAVDNPDLGSKILGPLKFGSVGSNAKTLFIDPIDLNPAGASSPARTITVTAGTGGDSAEISGVISSSSDPGGSPATLTKNGTGTLILSATNTYSGATTIAAGTLSVSSIGNASANSNIGTNGTIRLGAAAAAGTLKYTGTGETSNKVIDLAGTTGGGAIDQSGTGLLKFTSNLTATGAGAKTLTLQGSTAGTGEVGGVIANGTGATAVTKAGTGQWTLAAANTYSGGTTVSAGNLTVAGAAATLGTGNVTVQGTTAGTSLVIQSGVANAIGNTAALNLLGGGTPGVADQGYANLGAGINELVGSLLLNGVAQAGGTYGATGSGATHILDEYFAGSGIIPVPVVGLPGDFNNDGKVDAGDYVTWKKNQGTSNALANDNGLGTPIGTAHYNLWRANFGNPPGAGSGGGLGVNGGAVPEPSSIALLMLGLAALLSGRRERQ